jgi:hypothetical protein
MFPGGLRPDGLPAALSDPGRIAAVQATGLLDTEPALGREGADRGLPALAQRGSRGAWCHGQK